MQKWVENVVKDWVEYPFLTMPANANIIANDQCGRTHTPIASSICTP